MAKALDSAVFVTDIPYITDDVEEVKDKLEKYFGQAKHGGGDVENIICPVGGALTRAIVVFESPKDADSVVQRGEHVFEDVEIDVKKLPPVCSLIEVDVEQYYWDVIPREKTESFINDLKRGLSPLRNVTCQKYSVQKVSGTYEELERMEEDILQMAGFGTPQGASAVVGARQVLSRCVEVTNIPYLTDDVQKLKTTLREEIKQASKVTVTDVIAPIKGNMARAIVVFASNEDRDYYFQQSSHPLDGEDLKLDIPPKVFRNSSVALDKFYKALIPKKNSEELKEKLKETFGTDVSFNGKEIKAPFEYLNDVIDAWMEGTGLAQRMDCATSSDTTAKEEETDLPADEERDTDLQRFSSVPSDSWEKVDVDGTEDNIHDQVVDNELTQDLSRQHEEEIHTEENPSENDSFIVIDDKASNGDPTDVSKDQVVDNEMTQDLSGQHEEEIKREENPSENDSFIVIDDKASNGDLTDVSKDQEPVFQTTSQPHLPTDKTADLTQDTNQDITGANDVPVEDEEKDREGKLAEEDQLGAGNGKQTGETEEGIAAGATIGNENTDKFQENGEDSALKETGDQQMQSTNQTQNLRSPAASNETDLHISIGDETTQEIGDRDLMNDDLSNAGVLDSPATNTSSYEKSDNGEHLIGISTSSQSTVSSSRAGSDRAKNITLAVSFTEMKSPTEHASEHDMEKSESKPQPPCEPHEDNIGDSRPDSADQSRESKDGHTESDQSRGTEETNVDASAPTSNNMEDEIKIKQTETNTRETPELPAAENESPKKAEYENTLHHENVQTEKMAEDVKQTQSNQLNVSAELQSTPGRTEITEEDSVVEINEPQSPLIPRDDSETNGDHESDEQQQAMSSGQAGLEQDHENNEVPDAPHDNLVKPVLSKETESGANAALLAKDDSQSNTTSEGIAYPPTNEGPDEILEDGFRNSLDDKEPFEADAASGASDGTQKNTRTTDHGDEDLGKQSGSTGKHTSSPTSKDLHKSGSSDIGPTLKNTTEALKGKNKASEIAGSLNKASSKADSADNGDAPDVDETTDAKDEDTQGEPSESSEKHSVSSPNHDRNDRVHGNGEPHQQDSVLQESKTGSKPADTLLPRASHGNGDTSSVEDIEKGGQEKSVEKPSATRLDKRQERRSDSSERDKDNYSVVDETKVGVPSCPKEKINSQPTNLKGKESTKKFPGDTEIVKNSGAATVVKDVKHVTSSKPKMSSEQLGQQQAKEKKTTTSEHKQPTSADKGPTHQNTATTSMEKNQGLAITGNLSRASSKGGSAGNAVSSSNPDDNSDAKMDYFSIDALTYTYLQLTSNDQLRRILTKFKVDIVIQTPNAARPADQIAVFKPEKKATIDDQANAKEVFIKLYQKVFYDVKRVSLKCGGLPEHKARKALDEVQRRKSKVVVQKDNNGFIFGGDEKDVQEAITIFRQEAGIQPAPRRLLKRKTSTDFENDGDEYVYSASQEKRGRKAADELIASESRFCSKEGLQMIIVKADITKQKVDIIVNAANGRLDHSGGVAGAISRAAGYQLQRDCKQMMYHRKPLGVGECIETRGYQLPCRYVIHAIGPVYQNQHRDRDAMFYEALTQTFNNILKLAEGKGAKSIAIPLISSGNFGGPKELCANALGMALFDFSRSQQRRSLQQILLVNIDQGATSTIQSKFEGLFRTLEDFKRDEDIEHERNVQQRQSKSVTFKTSEGIDVVVTQGDITQGSVEVIVNAANGQLLHGGGVAGAIARVAGRRIQEECNQIIAQRGRPLRVGECEVTDGYNLKCKVIHAVGPEYNKCHSDKEFFDKLKQTFITAIKHANIPVEAKQVALPLVSSGIFGGPNQLCAKALAEAVQEFSRNEGYLVLKRIFLVNIDKETTDEVRRACEVCFSGATSSGAAAASIDRLNASSTERSDDDDGGFSVKSNRGITISVLLGDITKQHVDVIVSPTSPTLRHDGGVGGAISDAAGYQLQKHCNLIYKETRKTQVLSVGETVVTSGFDLRCGHIIHTLGPTFRREDPNRFCQALEHTYTSCLQLANTTMKMNTVAVPLIGASSGPRETCAKAFADALHWLDKEANISLKKITLVTKDEACFTAVQNVLAGYFQSETASTADVDTTGSGERFPEYVFKTTEDMEIRVRTDDVSKQATDIIFNYTDEKMTNTGKLSQRLCEAAGPKLQEECTKRIKERKVLSKGSFLSTEGFQLPCKHIMHAAIPHQHSQSEEDSEMNWLVRTYMSCFFTAKTTLRAKSITVPLIYSTDTNQDVTNAYCNALATAILGFSKKMQQTSSMLTIYVVNFEPTATAVVKQVFSDTFKCVDIIERQTSPSTSAVMEEATATVPVISKQPTRGLGLKNPLPKAAFSNQHIKPDSVKHDNRMGQASQNTKSSSITLLSQAKMCETCNKQKENVHTLEGCKHRACLDCIRDFVTPNSLCQKCGALYSMLTEPTLGGRMKYYHSDRWKLEEKPAIAMAFDIPTGVQSQSHLKPRRQYKGLSAVAYLPDTEEGREVLSLLTWAFLNGFMFEISTSGSGEHDRVILGDIPLKYKTHGGFEKGAYPDSQYLPKVKQLVKGKEAMAQGTEVD